MMRRAVFASGFRVVTLSILFLLLFSPLRAQKVGIVLGGGGAKGAALVGALKVIEETGVPIHCIAGTSIGGIVGALYAVGYRAEQLDSLFRTQEWIELFTRGTLRDHFERVIKECPYKPTRGSEGNTSWNEPVKIPFACVAVDILNQKEVVLRNGSLPLAMRATMAIPGFFKPVRINGRTLVDGGMMNLLPVDVAKDMGADIIIAIDLQQEQHETRNFSLKNILGIGGILDWAVSRPDWKKYNENVRAADIYIQPNLDGYSVADVNAREITEMIALGESAARAQLPQIKKLIQQ